MTGPKLPIHTGHRAALVAALVAALLAASGSSPAGAIARPKKEPGAEARACPEVGEGYVRVPGSATCLRVGGSVRVEGGAIRR